MSRARYDREDRKANGIANLRLDIGLFWWNDSSGVEERKGFFDANAKKVKVSSLCEDLSDADYILVNEGCVTQG